MTAPDRFSTWRWEDWRLPSGLTGRAALPANPRHPPLLLLHGLGGGAWYWEQWQGFLAERGWPSYALNLRGHHGSRPVADLGGVTLRDYVDDAREAAAALDGACVVGHSLGGLLAQALAAEGAVRAAVLLCSAPPAGIRLTRPALAIRQLRNLWPMLRSQPLVGRPEDYEWLSLHRIPASEREALSRRFVPDSGTVARELSFGGMAVDGDRVSCPMVSVAADEDRFLPPRVGREIAARYHCSFWRYAGHAHFVVMEPGWELIAADCERWLAHVLTLPEHEREYAELWLRMQEAIGEERELEFHDGRRVLAEVINVDLARHQDVIYEPREVRDPGPGRMHKPTIGETARTWLYELRA